jgi:hypothetical protein
MMAGRLSLQGRVQIQESVESPAENDGVVGSLLSSLPGNTKETVENVVEKGKRVTSTVDADPEPCICPECGLIRLYSERVRRDNENPTVPAWEVDEEADGERTDDLEPRGGHSADETSGWDGSGDDDGIEYGFDDS